MSIFVSKSFKIYIIKYTLQNLSGIASQQAHLLLLLGHELLLPGLSNVLGLDAHDTATPLALVVDVVVELSAEVLAQGLELGLILLLDGSDRAARSGLLVDDGSQSSLAFNNTIRDILL